MKAPSVSSDAGGVFQCWGRWQQSGARQALAEPLRRFRILLQGVLVMPVWLEVLINVLGYAGFVGVATFNPLSGEAAAEADGQRAVS